MDELKQMMAAVIILSAQYGAVTVHGAVFYQSNGQPVPQADVDAAMAQAVGKVLATEIKFECSRRIDAVMKDLKTQANITGYVLSLALNRANGFVPSQDEQADLALAVSMKDWVKQMLGTSRALVIANDADYTNDTKWPAPPVGARAFSDRF